MEQSKITYKCPNSDSCKRCGEVGEKFVYHNCEEPKKNESDHCPLFSPDADSQTRKTFKRF